MDLDCFLKANPGTTHLDVLLIDLCGNAIGKRIPRSAMQSFFEQGTPVCAAMQLVDVCGNTADPMGYGFSNGDPDAFAIPIAGTLSTVPWLTGYKSQVLCEYLDAQSRQPLWFEPRQVLKRVLSRFESMDIHPVVAVELEFYLLDAKRDDNGRPQPARSPRTGQPDSTGKVLSLDKLDEFEPILSSIEEHCRLQSIPTTSMISEYGAGQFEINLMHQTDVLAAADQAALLRRAVQGSSRSKGYDASFMSKPFIDESGSGLHVHVSLQDSNGDNIFAAEDVTKNIPLRRAVSGLQATMAEGMAFFAPNINVYRRFKADEFVPVTTDWGLNNRSVAFRVPPSDAKNTRIEHRVSGADANPYLVLATVLAGIHYGLENNLDNLSEPHSGNAGSEVSDELPTTMWSALDQLNKSSILAEYMGAEYLSIYHDVKQAEFVAFMDEIQMREHDWYL